MANLGLYGIDYGPTYSWDASRAAELAAQRNLPLYTLTDGSYYIAQLEWLTPQQATGATEVMFDEVVA